VLPFFFPPFLVVVVVISTPTPFPPFSPSFLCLFPVQDINAFLDWLELTLFSNRLVLVAVYCLMIAHPGFVFKKDRKDRSSAISQQELQEYNK
jgi:hypothetical protein